MGGVGSNGLCRFVFVVVFWVQSAKRGFLVAVRDMPLTQSWKAGSRMWAVQFPSFRLVLVTLKCVKSRFHELTTGFA